jgi:hypothetical protein
VYVGATDAERPFFGGARPGQARREQEASLEAARQAERVLGAVSSAERSGARR